MPGPELPSGFPAVGQTFSLCLMGQSGTSGLWLHMCVYPWDASLWNLWWGHLGPFLDAVHGLCTLPFLPLAWDSAWRWQRHTVTCHGRARLQGQDTPPILQLSKLRPE